MAVSLRCFFPLLFLFKGNLSLLAIFIGFRDLKQMEVRGPFPRPKRKVASSWLSKPPKGREREVPTGKRRASGWLPSFSLGQKRVPEAEPGRSKKCALTHRAQDEPHAKDHLRGGGSKFEKMVDA